MKRFKLMAILIASTAALVACGGDDGGSKTATTPTSAQCTGYTYNGSHYVDAQGRRVNCGNQNRHVNNSCIQVLNGGGRVQGGVYYDHRGQIVQCNDNYYGHNQYSGLIDYNNFFPYGGGGCSIYNSSMEVYYPVNFGYGLVCVGYYNIISYHSPMTYGYGGFGSPIYHGCRTGVDPNCSGFGGTLGINANFGFYTGY